MSAATAGRLAESELLATVNRPGAISSQPQFELVAQLSLFWARPIAFVDASYLAIGPLTAKSIVAMDRNPAFRGPINASISEALGLDRKAPDTAFLDKVATSAAHRLVVLLLTSPIGAVQRAGLTLAAAILSRRISGLIMKTDRTRARQALGEEAFQIAVEEAPLMYGSLSDLDLKVPGAGPLQANGDVAADMAIFGRAVLARLCDAIGPTLSDVFALRFAHDPAIETRTRFLGNFTSTQVDLALRMIRRKEAAWLATIA